MIRVGDESLGSLDPVPAPITRENIPTNALATDRIPSLDRPPVIPVDV
jgi:hypothetical protein